jgi:hypothetical protein
MNFRKYNGALTRYPYTIAIKTINEAGASKPPNIRRQTMRYTPKAIKIGDRNTIQYTKENTHRGTKNTKYQQNLNCKILYIEHISTKAPNAMGENADNKPKDMHYLDRGMIKEEKTQKRKRQTKLKMITENQNDHFPIENG